MDDKKGRTTRVKLNPVADKPLCIERYATLRFFNETDFVLFGIRYVLGEEEP